MSYPLNKTLLQPRGVERYETIVIGGGQAGLATGYHLAQRDADFLILDANDRVGDSWRNRWDSLRLFTPAKYSGLPGMTFPAPAMHLPDKDEVADYMEKYAERFDLPIRPSTQVTSLTHDGDRYVVRTENETYEADSVIVATGPFQRPRVPKLAARLPRSVRQLHSSEYHNPLELTPAPVLVVGVGNSGAQIALEIVRSRNVYLAGSESGYLRRTLLGLDIYRWIWPFFTWFNLDTRVGKRIRDRSTGADPLVGIDPRSLSAAGIQRVGKVTEVRDGLPVCDGESIDVATVIWCTGFEADYSWIDLRIFGEDGYPRRRGRRARPVLRRPPVPVPQDVGAHRRRRFGRRIYR
jgi:putative flavoprotein involved in K+ transport